MPAAKKKVHAVSNDFDDYMDTVVDIAAKLIDSTRPGDRAELSRNRALIRAAVEKYMLDLHESLKRNMGPDYVDYGKNRFDVVCRALAIGVTKALEAWEYTAINRAWPEEI